MFHIYVLFKPFLIKKAGIALESSPDLFNNPKTLPKSRKAGWENQKTVASYINSDLIVLTYYSLL